MTSIKYIYNLRKISRKDFLKNNGVISISERIIISCIITIIVKK